ncbi:AraC family transcriptional regulator [Turneriella parva]|uniref:Transcriptional regulator, AraC family n=1 Tax=Turneriella parva (strain ATCC BAA-1111 / DSM 21527 / NCTC 11395 / H) TaxID=869212 RepID=I4B4U8_TURPD|nr:helix-turn-helix domain-containing protein [Turneriella parva]AFM12305.1 transcriptional regulator, AraC family [Turneriella parva DSM 21527]
MEILFLFAVGQFLTIAVLLLRRRFEPGVVHLIALLVVYAATVLVGFLYSSQLIFRYPAFARLGFPLMALLGPLVFLLMADLTRERALGLLSRIFLFIVPAAELAYLVPFFLSPNEVKIRYLTEDLQQLHLDCLVLLYTSLAYNLGLFLWGWTRLLRRLPEGTAMFLRLGAYSVPALSLLVALISAFDRNLLNSGLFSGFMALVALIFSYLVLFRLVDPARVRASIAEGEKYQKSALGDDALARLGAKIEAAYDDQNIHQELDFSLARLAQALGEPAQSLSQVFTRHFNASFYEYTTRKRLQKFEQLLVKNPDETILSLAYQAGFGSKATFNAAFKNKHGISPSAYLKRLRQSQSSG